MRDDDNRRNKYSMEKPAHLLRDTHRLEWPIALS